MNATDAGLQSRIPESLFAKLAQLPDYMLGRLLAAPVRGESQKELFRDACTMKRTGFTPAEQRLVLQARFQDYYRQIEDREIDNAIDNASDDNTPRPRRWPLFDPNAFQAIAAKYPDAMARLRSESPVANPHLLSCGAVIDHFFKESDLLCMAGAGRGSYTKPRPYFRGMEETFPYMVPNPMSKPLGLTKKGHTYNRCLDNVGPRLRAVIEFDRGTLDEQAAVHLQLRAFGVPLIMVVFSGSKSLHGWYDVSALSESDLEHFFRYAAYVGADPMTFGRAQLVRTPNGWRDGNEDCQQCVEFLT